MVTNIGESTPTTRSAVLAVFKQVAHEQDKRLPALLDDMPLMDSGLDSLSFAIMVARLEDLLDCDPFATANDSPFPVTLGDFIKFYENAAE